MISVKTKGDDVYEGPGRRMEEKGQRKRTSHEEEGEQKKVKQVRV